MDAKTTERKIETLRKQVETVMRENPKTRDDDKLLTVAVWMKYYLPPYRTVVNLTEIMELPSQASIKRVRAKIQNVAKEYLPTTAEVAKIRKISEEAWIEAMSK